MTTIAERPLLEVDRLTVDYRLPRPLLGRRRSHRAVDDVSFAVAARETLGLVGESGSGKSTIGRAILGLVKPLAGTITFDGTELTSAPAHVVRRIRPEMQVVFQNPYASLNPALTVGDAIGEPLRVHRGLRGAACDNAVADLLRQIGLDPGTAGRLPRAFSGGQRQRIAVARAIALRPRLLIADEPVSSLDVSTRGQIVNLLDSLRDELGLAEVFIGHDLAVVRHISDRIAVMHAGRMVEIGPADEVAERPLHPYTQRLVAAIPVPDPAVQAQRRAERVTVEEEAAAPGGCPYVVRCEQRMDICRRVDPSPRRSGAVTVRCHLYPAAVTAAEPASLPVETSARRSPHGSPVPTTVAADAAAAGLLVAGRILDLLEATDPDRMFVLACPAGRTPRSTYAALGRLAVERGADLSRVVIIMVDEYLDGAGRGLCDPTAHYSCRRYLDEELLGAANAGLPAGRQIRRDQVRFPDPERAEDYERTIAGLGGIDVILLASGASDGHVAFNPPGSDLASVTRVVDLAHSTRQDNVATFPGFGGVGEVPSRGVTIGLSTILRARRAIMMLLGPEKAGALTRLLACRRFDPEWPASVVAAHDDAWIVVDRAAAGTGEGVAP